MKKLLWIGSSKDDLKSMPGAVQQTFGFALHQAQVGKKHPCAKPLKGLGSASVLDIVENAVNATFCAVYTVKFSNLIYVLHCFQKKSTSGIATPRVIMDLVRERLKIAEARSKGDLT